MYLCVCTEIWCMSRRTSKPTWKVKAKKDYHNTPQVHYRKLLRTREGKENLPKGFIYNFTVQSSLSQNTQKTHEQTRAKATSSIAILTIILSRHLLSTIHTSNMGNLREESDMGVAPEGAQCLDCCCSQDVLMIGGRDGSSDEGPHPEDPLKN